MLHILYIMPCVTTQGYNTHATYSKLVFNVFMTGTTHCDKLKYVDMI